MSANGEERKPARPESREGVRGDRPTQKERGGAPAGAKGRPAARGGRERPAGGRDPGGHHWYYGIHAVRAALQNPRRTCHLLLATKQALERLGRAVERPGLEIRIVSPREVARVLPEGATHQGVALKVAPLPPVPLERILAIQGPRSLFLMLDQITDPRNMGAILRTAVAMGVNAVVVQERRSAELNGACARAAAGAVDMIPVVEVVNLTRALLRLKEAGYRVTGLDAEAPTPIEALADAPRRVLVFGSEGSGIRRLVGETCDELARITTDPRMESLNVSVAAGIALYVVRRVLPRTGTAAAPEPQAVPAS
ncbi:23S rRNA (guanosine-2'-O-)-methyltransferase RlmB [bacterium HR39]|nr:23S rRNA (guanosine-2'-O-)-methyltransferase RlmB [bacterium HR39]